MATYSEFLSFVKNDGLAKQNRYAIELSAPAISGEFAAYMSMNNIRNLILLSKAVTVPGVNVATTEIVTTGEVINAPYDRNFGAANFSFYVDAGMLVRKFFDDWINSIQDPETRVMGWYKNFIVPEIKITVIPRSELGVVYRIVLHECFPKSIGALSLDNENNGIMTLDVEIDYHYYTTEAIVMQRNPASGTKDTFAYRAPILPNPPVGDIDTYRYTAPYNQPYQAGAIDSFDYVPPTSPPYPAGAIDTYRYVTPVIGSGAIPGGKIDSYVYSVNNTNNSSSTVTIPGIPGNINVPIPNTDGLVTTIKNVQDVVNGNVSNSTITGAVGGVVNDLINNGAVQITEGNPIDILRDGFSSMVGDYKTEFETIQSVFSNSQVVYNGEAVPLNVDSIINIAKTRTMGTVRSAVLNAAGDTLGKAFPNIRITGLF